MRICTFGYVSLQKNIHIYMYLFSSISSTERMGQLGLHNCAVHSSSSKAAK